MLFALTEEKLVNIFRAIELGMPKTRAAIFGDISQNAFHRYDKRGTELLAKLESGDLTVTDLSDEDRLCVTLVVGMEKAKSKGLSNWLQVINDAGTSDWRSAAWLTERVFSKEFGKRTFEEKEVTKLGATASAENVEDLLAIKRRLRDWEEEEFGDAKANDS